MIQETPDKLVSQEMKKNDSENQPTETPLKHPPTQGQTPGKKKNLQDDETLSTILLSLKSKTSSNSSNNENETTDVANAASATDTPSTGTGESTTPIIPTHTSTTTLTPLPDTVLPAPPALSGTEVLDEAEYNRRMTIEYLRQYFHLPLNEVATLWGVSKPAFKKLCRQHGIKRWPSRQVSSIISSITMLQNFCQENELPEKILKEYESRLACLHTSLEQIMQAPSLDAIPEPPNFTLPAISTATAGGSSVPPPALGSPDSRTDVPELPSEESVLLTAEEENKKKRRRSSGGASRMNVHSPLDPHTGWVAECHKCGKIGKYRNVFEGRPFQHSTGDGKYCGYFRLNPRKIGSAPPQSALSDSSEIVDTSVAASPPPTYTSVTTA